MRDSFIDDRGKLIYFGKWGNVYDPCKPLGLSRFWDPRWTHTPDEDPEAPNHSSFYQYKPLRAHEIRVLYIERSDNFHSRIKCSIKHGPIHNYGIFDPYMTLSYTWGPLRADGSHLNKTIYCNGKRMLVTSNLRAALRYIRHNLDEIERALFATKFSQKPVGIWIDAICINQIDTVELSLQVKQMAEVYSNSSKLIIWLGKPKASNQQIISRWSNAELKTFSMPGDILDSPWFSRRWVIEEYALTPFHSRFYLFGNMLMESCLCHELLKIEIEQRRIHLLTYDDFGFDPCDSLLYHMYRFEDAACSRPHDLIYSMLPLCFGSREIAGIRINYEQSIEQCFVEVARSIIEATNVKVERLGPLLAIAAAKKDQRNDRRLPSWVPDWRIPSRYESKDHFSCVKFLMDPFGTRSIHWVQ